MAQHVERATIITGRPFNLNVDEERQAGRMRTFSTGATRNVDENKPDPEGFLSPLFLDGYGAYMQAHRTQADGSLRASDNWQKGIPLDAYRKSLLRHVLTAWKLWRGYTVPCEQVGTQCVVPTLLDALYAAAFNLMGMIHEEEKAKNQAGRWLDPASHARLHAAYAKGGLGPVPAKGGLRVIEAERPEHGRQEPPVGEALLARLDTDWNDWGNRHRRATTATAGLLAGDIGNRSGEHEIPLNPSSR